MIYENLKFKKARIVEITPTYVGVIMDGHRHFNIGICSDNTAFDIKRNILSHAIDETGRNIVPFDKLEDVPEEIRNELNLDIDLIELKGQILEEEEKLSRLKTINCNEAREEMLPKYNELLEALYEKDINGNSNNYEQLMERIKLTYELFPKELGDIISVEQYEEIINGL